jgi:hypothetical protein
MATIKHWVDVNTSPSIAEREWQRFAFSSMIGGYHMPDELVRWSEAYAAQDSGLVSFYGSPTAVTRVMLAIDYDSCATTHASDAVDKLVRSRLFMYRSLMNERYGVAAEGIDEAFVSAFRKELPQAA